MYTPPKVPDKFKELYIIINAVIILSFVVLRIFVGGIRDIPIHFAGVIAVFALFNGIWSINKSLYSWFYRGANSYFKASWSFLLLIVTGALLIVCVAAFLIM